MKAQRQNLQRDQSYMNNAWFYEGNWYNLHQESGSLKIAKSRGLFPRILVIAMAVIMENAREEVINESCTQMTGFR